MHYNEYILCAIASVISGVMGLIVGYMAGFDTEPRQSDD